MSTLVFHTGALGDSVLIWPLLRALGHVTLVAPWSKARLAQRWLGGITAVDGESPEFARLYVPAGQCEAGEAVKKLLGGTGRVISFISDGADAWARNIRAMCSGPVVCVPSRPREGTSWSAVARHRFESRQPLRRLDKASGDMSPHSQWAIPFFHQRMLAEQGVNYEPVFPPPRVNRDGPVVVHPGSGGRQKCWASERFDALIEHLGRIGRPVQVVLGEVERERLDPRWAARWSRVCDVIEPADLIELSEVIGRAAVFIGNDSGPTHLAAQLGVATVALFGPTDPRVWAPVGPAVTLVAPPQPCAMDWLEVERVTEAVARR